MNNKFKKLIKGKFYWIVSIELDSRNRFKTYCISPKKPEKISLINSCPRELRLDSYLFRFHLPKRPELSMVVTSENYIEEGDDPMVLNLTVHGFGTYIFNTEEAAQEYWNVAIENLKDRVRSEMDKTIKYLDNKKSEF